MELIRQKVTQGLNRTHERAEKAYNTRSKLVEFSVGQVVYRKNYKRSNKAGNSVIFVCLDHFSKFVWLQLMRHAVAAEVIKFLETEIFHQYGVPEFIHSSK